MRATRNLLAIAIALVLGCDGAQPVADGGTDGGPPPDAPTADGGPPATELQLTGLDGPVDVIVDDRGVPHIYGTTVHDVVMVEGYLMARDRYSQMEFIRRNVLGRIAEVAGALSAGAIQDDRDQRFLGFGRTGRAIYESLAPTDPTRLVAEAFVDGINQWIDQVAAQPTYQPPRGHDAMNLILTSPFFDRWQASDVFALARFQAWNLSYDAGADVSRTRARTGVAAAFPSSSADEGIRARAGLYGDLWTDRPARRVYTRSGFPNVSADTGTRAFAPRPPGPALPRPRILPRLDPSMLARADAFFERIDRNLGIPRDEHVGSNSWVVSGDHTQSGNAILSNDPHLSLIAPGVWWYVHLDTATMGGENMIDAQGVAFAGLPGVVLGFNRDMAWSATTTGYDVTDVYRERVTYVNTGTPTAPVWVPQSVRFRGADVALETIDEPIHIQGQTDPEPFRVYSVPHHGPIIPDSYVYPTEVGNPVGEAMSVRYTGHETTNELAFFVGLLSASTFADAEAAQDNFIVGAQNFSFANAEGIRWSTQARIPQRDARACTFSYDANGVPQGISPLFVLDGENGEHEWTTDLEDRYIPHDENPAAGYIATANQDNVGVTDDGNPCNDDFYLGGDFDVGYRQARIRQRLDALVTRGDITTEDMITLQGESTSILGESLAGAFVTAIDHALGDPSDDPALAAAVTEAGASGAEILMDARTRLNDWSYATPHGVGASDASEIADSIATTVFNAALTRLTTLTLSDETDRIGRRPGSFQTLRAIEWAIAAPDTMYSYRADYAGVTGYDDSVIWDDMDTASVVETRDERIVRAILAGYAFLTTRLGADRAAWRWGRLHTIRFGQVVPALDGNEQISIPPQGDATFPDGFPRHGDMGAPDPGNFRDRNGVYDTTNFSFGSGASQRLVIEMAPAGPIPVNALPGGQVEDPDSPHHADEAEHWRVNEQPPLYFARPDVEAHAEQRIRVTTGP